jgi:hypothetical protein
VGVFLENNTPVISTYCLPHARGGVFSTYVINKYDFICDNCGKPWSEEIREEK